MARRHTFVVALLLGLSVVGGSVALGRTLELGAASTHANDAKVAARVKRLNAFEASLRQQLATTSAVPSTASVSAPPVQRVRYVRPAPVVVTQHASDDDYDDEGYESEGFEHEGGEDDD
jgi:hypothetical protein